MSTRLRAVGVVVALALATVSGAHAATTGLLGGQFRYWAFDNGNDNRNPIVYWVTRSYHVQLEVWDFEQGEDQFRPEFGIHLRDPRRSVYSAQWRHEKGLERFTLSTEQILTGHFVGKVAMSTLVAADSTDIQWSGGLDYYWGSWSFASAEVIRDPRGDGLWVFPMRARFADEDNDWVQFTLSPASERTIGWSVDMKYRLLRFGIEQNSRYDFTTRDNIVFSVGAEVRLPRGSE
jgi:hypothetical protein